MKFFILILSSVSIVQCGKACDWKKISSSYWEKWRNSIKWFIFFYFFLFGHSSFLNGKISRISLFEIKNSLNFQRWRAAAWDFFTQWLPCKLQFQIFLPLRSTKTILWIQMWLLLSGLMLIEKVNNRKMLSSLFYYK